MLSENQILIKVLGSQIFRYLDPGPELKQQDKSPCGVQTVVLVADGSGEAERLLCLINQRRLGKDGKVEGQT